ncbi:acyltransferase family protein [Hoeflea alexandrii]|uniref:acyltransferase family protein n=1 Tax=Hoeflea alexandrii TaxID=288436 RepID=UPI0022B00E65|nr:acyltransferase family protein [Hoeflea alexandrii]MCZ4288079.1 acyltransferase family protein [Hoeflea alexandrii]
MTLMQGERAQRLHHWDFSRALYLVLGIPFHAAVIYSLSHEWSVASPDKSQLLTWLADFLHSFRMPGFFLLAGLFSMMLLDRQGAWPWLRSRLVRLGLPLLSATLLIVPFQIAVQQVALAVKGTVPASDVPGLIAAQLSHFGEPWIAHLWFLWVLIAYCIGLAILQALSRGTLRARLEAFVAWVGDNRILSLAAVAAICELAARAQEIVVGASPYYGNAMINYNLYVIYFGFGALVYSSRKLNDLLLRPGPLAALAGVALVLYAQVPHANLIDHTLKVMAAILGALMIVGYISNLAHRHFNRPDARVRKLVDASFTIYLFHHPVIYVLATLFLMVDLPPVLEFAIIATSAGLISYAIHLAVSRSAALMLMFNGVRRKKAPVSQPSRADTAKPQSIPAERPYPLRG